jgi:hypothetical protein
MPSFHGYGRSRRSATLAHPGRTHGTSVKTPRATRGPAPGISLRGALRGALRAHRRGPAASEHVLVRPRRWSIALSERKKLVAEVRRCGYPAARVLERQRLK